MLLNSYQETFIEAGCDEAGRGCLIGPVYAAAVILPKDFVLEGLTDSKKVSEKQRNHLRLIIEKEALAWAVASVDNEEIDKINILNASILAMHKAIEQLKVMPQFLAIDGNRFKPYRSLPHQCVIKGDSKYLNIAAASILAKTHRDAFVDKIALEYPEYAWQQNKGYATAKHRLASIEYGLTPYHRKTFAIKA
ncbi:MAG: ribonuclease HII [Sphingobacteriaceae bacterium]|nr:ribonuclease HII [Sphingobacteriaceae bacterium]